MLPRCSSVDQALTLSLSPIACDSLNTDITSIWTRPSTTLSTSFATSLIDPCPYNKNLKLGKACIATILRQRLSRWLFLLSEGFARKYLPYSSLPWPCILEDLRGAHPHFHLYYAPALLTFNPNSHEYLALVGSFILVGLEAIIRVLTLALRESQALSERCRGHTNNSMAAPFLVTLFYRASRRLFNRFSAPARRRAESKRKSWLFGCFY